MEHWMRIRNPSTPEQIERRRVVQREYQARRRERLAPLADRIQPPDPPRSYAVPKNDPLYSVVAVASEIRVSQPTLIRWVKGCKLPTDLDPDLHYHGKQVRYVWPETVLKKLKAYVNLPTKNVVGSRAGVPRLPRTKGADNAL